MFKLNSLPLTSDPSRIFLVYKEFSMLVKREIPTSNLTCPPFVWHAKKFFNAHVDNAKMLTNGWICNTADSTAVLNSGEEDKNNQGNEEEQEEDADVGVELTNVISIAHAVDSLTAHDSDTPANLKSLSRKPIRRILSSKKSTRKKG